MPWAARAIFIACLVVAAAGSDNTSADGSDDSSAEGLRVEPSAPVVRSRTEEELGTADHGGEVRIAEEEHASEHRAAEERGEAELRTQEVRSEERSATERREEEDRHIAKVHGEAHPGAERLGEAKEGEDLSEEEHRAGGLETFVEHGEGGEGEEEEEGEEGEEGEEHEATPVDVAISSCLCGGVSFVMLLFYLVNNQDRDIRFYAWSIISSTISIFLSVLLYQGINTFITHYVVQFTSTGTWGIIGVAYTLMVGWMIVLEVVMMFIADVFKLPECILGNRHNMMQSWGRLCAHITGFASIRAGCSLHLLHHWIGAGPLSAAGVLVAHSAVLAGLGLLFEAVRNFIAQRRGIRSRWLEEICEMENDVSALSLSFLTVQVLRFAITGVMPNHEGVEEPQLQHSLLCSAQLFAAAASFAALVVMAVFLLARMQAHGGLLKRVLAVLQVTGAMACAWSIFFASKWELRRFFDTWDPNSMSARVALALVVSAGGFGLIFVLDKLEDLDSTGREVDRAIVNLISAMGILVGFSWEQSFEGAVGVFAGLTPYRHLAELSIACLTAVIVIPAWRNYILKSLVKSEASYLRNVSKQRTRDLSPEALELVMDAMNSTADLEIAPQVGRSSSRSVMLAVSGESTECSPRD